MPIVNPLPNTIANGQLEDAVPVMANFNWLVSQVNGNACPATSGLGMLKGNGTGGTSTAVAGTDYAGITSVNTFTQLQSGIAAVAAANFPITSQVQQSTFNTGASGGTADAITVTFTPSITSLTSAPIWWRATAANATTTPTLKRDGLVAKTIVKGSNQALVAGDIPGAGAWMCSQYDATLDKEVLLNPAYAVSVVAPYVYVPPGAIMDFARSVAPSGWVVADGSLLLRATYPALWTEAQASGNITASDAAWGATTTPGSYSPGDGSTTFRVPDLRNLYRRGLSGSLTIGQYQADDVIPHSHPIGVQGVFSSGLNSISSNNAAVTSFFINTSNSGGSETRPKTAVVLTCIKT